MKNQIWQLSLLLILLLVLSLYFYNLKQTGDWQCTKSDVNSCPRSCAVCPPCPSCSSISCHSIDVCKSNGFNASWYDEIKSRAIE